MNHSFFLFRCLFVLMVMFLSHEIFAAPRGADTHRDIATRHRHIRGVAYCDKLSKKANKSLREKSINYGDDEEDDDEDDNISMVTDVEGSDEGERYSYGSKIGTRHQSVAGRFGGAFKGMVAEAYSSSKMGKRHKLKPCQQVGSMHVSKFREEHIVFVADSESVLEENKNRENNQATYGIKQYRRKSPENFYAQTPNHFVYELTSDAGDDFVLSVFGGYEYQVEIELPSELDDIMLVRPREYYDQGQGGLLKTKFKHDPPRVNRTMCGQVAAEVEYPHLVYMEKCESKADSAVNVSKTKKRHKLNSISFYKRSGSSSWWMRITVFSYFLPHALKYGNDGLYDDFAYRQDGKSVAVYLAPVRTSAGVCPDHKKLQVTFAPFTVDKQASRAFTRIKLLDLSTVTNVDNGVSLSDISGRIANLLSVSEQLVYGYRGLEGEYERLYTTVSPVASMLEFAIDPVRKQLAAMTGGDYCSSPGFHDFQESGRWQVSFYSAINCTRGRTWGFKVDAVCSAATSVAQCFTFVQPAIFN